MSPRRRKFSPDATRDDILEFARETPLVCATIFARSKNEFLQRAVRGASLGCDIVELRIDHLTDKEPSILGDIIQNSPLPLIVTNRSVRDGGLFPKSKESMRLSLLRSSLESGPAFIDVELDLEKKDRSKIITDAKKRKVGVICSHHDFKATPPSPAIIKLGGAISETGADIAKQAYFVRNENDSLKIVEAASAQGLGRKLFTTFGMGWHGKLTRLHTLMFGSCLIYCSIDVTQNKLGQIGVKFARKYVDSLDSYEFPQTEKGRNLMMTLVQQTRTRAI